MSIDFSRLERWTLDEVRRTVSTLPRQIRELASRIPVCVEPRPMAALIEDGVEPDTLGLFVGPEFGLDEGEVVGPPPQVFLFVENLWDFAGGDEEVFRTEVRVTLLHELGHYLGLDEDDLFDRGLE